MRAAINKRKLAAVRRVMGGGGASRLEMLEKMASGLYYKSLLTSLFCILFILPKTMWKMWAKCYYPHFTGGKSQEQ